MLFSNLICHLVMNNKGHAYCYQIVTMIIFWNLFLDKRLSEYK